MAEGTTRRHSLLQTLAHPLSVRKSDTHLIAQLRGAQVRHQYFLRAVFAQTVMPSLSVYLSFRSQGRPVHLNGS